MNQEERRHDQYQEGHELHEDDIQLIDYLRVIWKWKWLIFGGTLICGLIAIFASLMVPKTYEVVMSIQPGIVGVSGKGVFMRMDSVDNMRRKIDGQVYNQRIRNILNIDPETTRFKFGADGKRRDKSSFIKIKSEWREKDVDLGLRASKQLITLLSEDYKAILEQRRGDYDKRIAINQNEISKVEVKRKDIDKQVTLKLSAINKLRNQISFQQASLKTIRERIAELMLEAKAVKDNTDRIIKQRDMSLKENSGGDNIPMLLYSTTVQQNVAYFNQLNNQIYDLRTRKKETVAKIEDLNKDIDDILTEIQRLKLRKTAGLQTEIDIIKAKIAMLALEKAIISNVMVVQPPEASSKPIKPRKKVIVLISCLVGFFFLMILAFFIEYIKNASKLGDR